jgi:predicted Zn-dependent protease
MNARRSASGFLPLSILLMLCWACAPLVVACPEAPLSNDPVMQAMADELERSMAQLRMEGLAKPYFISYRVDDYDTWRVSASFGSLVEKSENRRRWLRVEVRVGDYDFDNTNFFNMTRRPSTLMRTFRGTASLPLEDDPQEIRRQIWLATDGAFKDALEQFSLKQAALQNKTLAEEIPDFSHEDPVQTRGLAEPLDVGRDELVATVRSLSALFRQMPDVFTSSVRLDGSTIRSRYINSEGGAFLRVSPPLSLTVVAGTQAVDGSPIQDFISVYGRRLADFPPTEQLESETRRLGARLAALRDAPQAERYNGPVLVEGQAAAELFAEVFAPKLLADRAPVTADGSRPRRRSTDRSFQERIGGRVLPRFFRVEDDPTLADVDGVVLAGFAVVDDQGVPTRRTTLIEHGLLRTMLTDRTPIPGVSQSTGNHRGGGVLPGNLIVTPTTTMSTEQLKRELLVLVEERDAEFGILVRRMGNPQFRRWGEIGRLSQGVDSEVEPLVEVYRIYRDGREELVRNAIISGISAASFKDIVAASATRTIYNVPFWRRAASGKHAYGTVGLVVPSLLFDDLTITKPTGEVPRLPVAPHPFFVLSPSDSDRRSIQGLD